MLRNDYQFALVFFRENGTQFGQVAANIDWEPAREWAEFQAFRSSGELAASAQGDFVIEPVRHAQLGEPFASGFRIGSDNGEPSEAAFGIKYFGSHAAEAIRQFTERGDLKEGDRFFWIPAAFAKQPANAGHPKPLFTTEEVSPGLQAVEGEMPAHANPRGNEEAEADFPALIPSTVLSEAAEMAKAAGAVETGGILIGYLRRDASTRELYAEVTAQIPARHTEADSTRLTFTAGTWTEVRAALSLRRKDEIMLGWWHSHPVHEWCKNCDPAKQRDCQMAKGFFSAHDRALHRAIFPRAYSLALVVNGIGFAEPAFSMFGWRKGLIEEREFIVTGGDERTAPDVPGAFAAARCTTLHLRGD